MEKETNKKETLTDSLIKSRRAEPSSQSLEKQETTDYNKLKSNLSDFQKKVVKKYPFIKALGILPPNSRLMFEEDENLSKEVTDRKPIHLIMIIPEDEYKNLNKIRPEVVKLAGETKENLWVHIKTSEVDLWSYGLDSKFEFLDAISGSYPLYDNGFLGALRVANIHKSLVLNWLNVGRIRYVATYAIYGSLVRGTAGKTSDVDVTVIIDDTDVKKMSRVELIEKLRGRIVGEFVKEATAMAGVDNILNVQVWLLTDFWQRVKDAEPIAFTFIRDGIPMYDRGTFIPWKRLLQMGRIKPSPEAIDLYMKEGDRTEELVKRRLLDAMVDIYYGVVTPTQAMMMLAGYAPPVPKVIVEEVRKSLVEKEKVMSPKELKTLEKAVKLFKEYEHGKLKEIPGKDVDDLMKEFKVFSDKIKEVRSKLENKVQEHQANKIHEEVFSLLRTIFGNKGKEDLMRDFDGAMVKKGKFSGRMMTILREISNIRKRADSGKLTPGDMQRITGEAFELTQNLTEYSQRKEFVSLERGIAKISLNGKTVDLLSTNEGVFLVDGKKILKLNKPNKSLSESSRKELEQALAKTKEKINFSLSSEELEILKKNLGDFEIEF